MDSTLVVVVIILVVLLWLLWRNKQEQLIPLPPTLAHQVPPLSYPTLPPMRSENMTPSMSPSLPFGLRNGEVVRCPDTGRIYKIMDNQARRYLPTVYARDGNPRYRDVDCQLLNSVSTGANM